MSGWGWAAVAFAVICVLLGVVVALRRRGHAPDDDPDAAWRAARRAIRGYATDQRKRRKGTIRGKGQGGDLNTGWGIGSDSGGMP